MRMTWTEAVEKLRGLIEDEDAVFIKDNATDWTIDNLVDAVRDGDDGEIHDLAVDDGGITELDADGFRKAPAYWVVLRG